MIRPALRPSRRRTAALAIAGAAGLLTLGALIGKTAGGSAARLIPITTPVVVEAPRVPAPVVTVHVQPPAPAVAPPAPPTAAPAPTPAPRPRALVPHLDAWCIMPVEDGAEPLAACAWDDGLPAISADGALIARKVLDGHPTGATGVAIELLDTKTSRRVRRMALIAPERDHDAEGKPRPELAGRIVQRAAAAQRTLDAGGFRSLIALGDSGSVSDSRGAAPQIHAQFDDRGAMQIVDPARGVVLWQHRFGPSAPASTDPTGLCGSPDLRHLSAWWDPATGLVAAALTTTTGGCMCPTHHVMQLNRISAAALASR